MRVRLFINKVNALKAGKDEHGYRVVEIAAGSIPEPLREILACYPDKYGNEGPEADFYLDNQKARAILPLVVANQETVVALLQALLDKHRAEEAQKEQVWEDAVREWLQKPVKDFLDGYDRMKSTADKSNFSSYYIPNDPRLQAKLDAARSLEVELKAKREQKEAAEKLDKEKREKKAAETKAVRVQRLRAWVQKHGSLLVQGYMEEGYNDWVEMARKEFDAHTLESIGFSIDGQVHYGEDDAADDLAGYRVVEVNDASPTLEELVYFRFLRAQLQDREDINAVELKCVLYRNDDRDRDDVEQSELKIEIQRPDDSTLEYFFRCPTAAHVARVDVQTTGEPSA